MVVAGFGDMPDEPLHGLPARVDDLRVGELFPYRPGNDDPCVGPSDAHHLASVLGEGRDAREASGFALRVGHVAHPLVEERCRAGEKCPGLGKYLRVGRPSQPFVALRAVGGHGEVVRPQPPDRVGDQPVHEVVPGSDGAALHLPGDRGDGDGFDTSDAHLARGGDRDESVPEEGRARRVRGVAVGGGERVAEFHPGIRNAEVQAVDAPFGSVHPARLGSVSVVEQLGGQALQRGAFGGAEDKRGNRRAVLPEVDDQLLAGADDHRFAGAVFALHDNLSPGLLASSDGVPPDIRLHGRECEVAAEVDLGPL